MSKKSENGKVRWDSVFADFIVTVGVLMAATLICALIHNEDRSGTIPAIMIFMLAVFLIAIVTTGYIYGIVASFFAVIVVNWIFTYPFLELNFSLTGYPITFLTMLIVSCITSFTAAQIKEQEALRIETEKERIRANLLRSISHDIRTPLTSIVGATSVLLEDDKLPEEMRQKLLEDVRDDGQWLIRVTENILSITRVGEDDARINTQPELAEEVIETSVRKFIKRHQDAPEVRTVLSEEPVMANMDIMLIEQVMTNLLENAYIHGKGATYIAVECYAENDKAVFTVTDDGKQIPTEKLPTLFSGIIKSDDATTHEDKRCMGIGLAVCKTIVDAHNGYIKAENLPENAGVRFTFAIPMEKEVLNED